MKTIKLQILALSLIGLTYCGGGGSTNSSWINTQNLDTLTLPTPPAIDTTGLLVPSTIDLECYTWTHLNQFEVVVYWDAIVTTATEFEIERSNDGVNFFYVDSVNPADEVFSHFLPPTTNQGVQYRIRAALFDEPTSQTAYSDYSSVSSIMVSVFDCPG